MLPLTRAKPIRQSEKILFIDRFEHFHYRRLDDLVFLRGNTQRSLAAVCLRNVNPSNKFGSVSATVHFVVQGFQSLVNILFVLSPRYSIHPTGRVPQDISEQLDVEPAKFFVRRHIRPQYACRPCTSITAMPVPPAVIDGGMAVPT